jgi:hypothetical protein
MPKFTNFPNGITSLGIPTFGTSGLPPFTGNYWWVQELYGTATAGGNGTYKAPFGTLQQAHDAAANNNNDVIFLVGTVHQTAALTWTKNLTHLYGVCAPLRRGKRARISSSGSTPFSYLVNVSGFGCLFQNFGTFYGFPTTGATTPICWNDTGGRNCYNGIEFLGFGDPTTTTGTANQTAARAFKLNTSTGETTWRSCIFGTDTVVRNATNYTLEIAGGAPRCAAIDCDFEADLGNSGGSSSHVVIPADGIDRRLNMTGCNFTNATLGMSPDATAMTQCFNINGAPGGAVLARDCTGYGFTHWETTASGFLVINMPAPTAHDGGIAIAASPS